jgi:hypothetical protein
MSNFWDLINIDEYGKSREQFSQDRWNVSFYCKDCKDIVETQRESPQWYVFCCKTCQWQNVVIGTLEGLKSNYKIK